jgi:hypothetical protein
MAAMLFVLAVMSASFSAIMMRKINTICSDPLIVLTPNCWILFSELLTSYPPTWENSSPLLVLGTAGVLCMKDYEDSRNSLGISLGLPDLPKHSLKKDSSFLSGR